MTPLIIQEAQCSSATMHCSLEMQHRRVPPRDRHFRPVKVQSANYKRCWNSCGVWAEPSRKKSSALQSCLLQHVGANNYSFLLAWAVMGSENGGSWRFFMSNLCTAIPQASPCNDDHERLSFLGSVVFWLLVGTLAARWHFNPY
jgi:hypothetical protein